MPKLNTYKVFQPEQDFLAFPDHYVNIVGKIAYADLAGLAKADAAGNQVIKRGTLVNMDADGVVKKCTTTLKPNAIIFDTIKVADYDSVDTTVNATVLVHGFVREDRLTLLDANATVALLKTENPMIYVVKK